MESDDVTRLIDKSLQKGRMRWSYHPYYPDYVTYLYLMAKNYLDDPRFSRDLRDMIKCLILYIMTGSNPVEEKLFLFSTITRKDQMKKILDVLNHDQGQSFIKVVIDTNIITVPQILQYSMSKDIQFVDMFLNKFFIDPIIVRNALNKYKGNDIYLIEIMEKYVNKMTLNQV